MENNGPLPARVLPERPDIRHLKDEARDLVRAGAAPKLSSAQYAVARAYGFPSWSKLTSHVESLGRVGRLKAAIDSEDVAEVIRLMTLHPNLHTAPLGYNKNGPLTWVAECRVPRRAPTRARLEMAQWMIDHGSDIHQGGDGPLMRAALDDDRIEMMELLVRCGADVNARWDGSYPILCAPCEAYAPGALRWLLAHGADPRVHSEAYGSALSMLLGTYSRNSAGKHDCLAALAEAGLTLPNTPVMALHLGRIDLLEAYLQADAGLLDRRFTLSEMFPPDLGMSSADGLHVTPLAGGTLLHLAIEWDEFEIAEWLLSSGADPNARARPDDEGFGNHTPLFHAVVGMGSRDGSKAQLLLSAGADPGVRATLRKQLRDMGDPELEETREFHNVTPEEYARQFQFQNWVSEPALALIRSSGRS